MVIFVCVSLLYLHAMMCLAFNAFCLLEVFFRQFINAACPSGYKIQTFISPYCDGYQAWRTTPFSSVRRASSAIWATSKHCSLRAGLCNAWYSSDSQGRNQVKPEANQQRRPTRLPKSLRVVLTPAVRSGRRAASRASLLSVYLTTKS